MNGITSRKYVLAFRRVFEDWYRIENKIVQQSLNIFYKTAINLIKLFKERIKIKRFIFNIMIDCLIAFNYLTRVIGEN